LGHDLSSFLGLYLWFFSLSLTVCNLATMCLGVVSYACGSLNIFWCVSLVFLKFEYFFKHVFCFCLPFHPLRIPITCVADHLSLSYSLLVFWSFTVVFSHCFILDTFKSQCLPVHWSFLLQCLIIPDIVILTSLNLICVVKNIFYISNFLNIWNTVMIIGS
jgi:hypothetical protein